MCNGFAKKATAYHRIITPLLSNHYDTGKKKPSRLLRDGGVTNRLLMRKIS